jgi:hypothetical protein
MVGKAAQNWRRLLRNATQMIPRPQTQLVPEETSDADTFWSAFNRLQAEGKRLREMMVQISGKSR